MFCREALAQLRDIYPEITRSGAQMIAAGLGTPADAAQATRSARIPFLLLSDPDRALYRALEARRMGPLDLFRPAVAIGALRAFGRGHRQVGVTGDPFQLGATAVVDRDGRVVEVRRARHAADHPPLDWIAVAVRREATRDPGAR
ncbi:MAG: AhpC/TSA family protein [Candidatus Eisenbacteria bacterium]